jgi:hypothetical protein
MKGFATAPRKHLEYGTKACVGRAAGITMADAADALKAKFELLREKRRAGKGGLGSLGSKAGDAPGGGDSAGGGSGVGKAKEARKEPEADGGQAVSVADLDRSVIDALRTSTAHTPSSSIPQQSASKRPKVRDKEQHWAPCPARAHGIS